MGNLCSGSSEESKKSAEIDAYLRKGKEEFRNEVKLLLLGKDKTTSIFRTIDELHGCQKRMSCHKRVNDKATKRRY
jgi:hypothetical protein